MFKVQKVTITRGSDGNLVLSIQGRDQDRNTFDAVTLTNGSSIVGEMQKVYAKRNATTEAKTGAKETR